MKACGSESGGWEPESPDHWRWLLVHGEGRERALAWIKLHSIARSSAWCIDEARKPLRVESMAADLGWELQTARNACAHLTQEGRIRTQTGRIFYRADVPFDTPNEESTSYKEKYSVQSIFPAYLHDFISGLPQPKRAQLEAYADWRRKWYAEGLAALRSIDDQLQDTILHQVGCKDKKHLPKRREDKLEWVHVAMAKPPNFVQSISAEEVEPCTESRLTLHKVVSVDARNFVQSDATLCVSATTTTSAKRFRPSSSDECAYVAERLQIDDDAAKELLMRSRKNHDTLTPRQLVHLAHTKLLQIGAHAKNRVGLLLAAVPKMARGSLLAAARKAAQQEIAVERRDAEGWMHADPRDYDSPEAAEFLRAEQLKARDTLARLDAEKDEM